jgi:signal transduction histidine kinase
MVFLGTTPGVAAASGWFSAGLVPQPIAPGRAMAINTYLTISAVCFGYLAELERSRRNEANTVAHIIREGETDAGLAGVLHSLMTAIGRQLRAQRALLAVRESDSDREYLLEVVIGADGAVGLVTSAELTAGSRNAYRFDANWSCWYISDVRALESCAAIALEDRMATMRHTTVVVPWDFCARHACQRLLGARVAVDQAWTGLLLILDPHVGLSADESMRVVRRIVSNITPTIRQMAMVHALRQRAEHDERLRIAHELHDGPIQALNAAVLQLSALREDERLTAEVSRSLSDLETSLRREIGNVRDLTQDMRLGLLEPDATHLVRELRSVVARFTRQYDVRGQFVTDVDFVHVSTPVRHQLQRALHEALVNVRKHSGAHEVLVCLRIIGRTLLLTVEDDGRGFAFEGRMMHAELEAKHVGPVVLRERVKSFGGELVVESRPGHGARLEIRVALEPAGAGTAR